MVAMSRSRYNWLGEQRKRYNKRILQCFARTSQPCKDLDACSNADICRSLQARLVAKAKAENEKIEGMVEMDEV